MNDDDFGIKGFIVLLVFGVILVGSFITWAVVHNEICSVCGQTVNNHHVWLLRTDNGVQFRACEKCIGKAFSLGRLSTKNAVEGISYTQGIMAIPEPKRENSEHIVEENDNGK